MALTADQIEALRGLQEAGIITAEEFARRVGAAGAVPAQAASNAQGGREIIFTSDIFSPGMRCATMRVPEGWQARTQVVPAPPPPGKQVACLPGQAHFLLEAVGPDGSTLRTLPGDVWLWSEHPQVRQTMQQAAQNPMMLNGCQVRPVPDAADYLKTQVLGRTGGSWLQNMRLGSEEKAPQILNRIHRQMEERRSKGLQNPDPNKIRMSTARLRLSGTRDGQPVDASLETAILLLWDTPPGAPAPLMTALVGEVVLRTAPAGTMPQVEPVFDAIADSMHIEDAWTQGVEHFGQRVNQEQQARFAAMQQQLQLMNVQNSQTMADANAEVSRIRHEMAMDNIRSIGERGRIMHNAQQQRYAQHNASVAANSARVHGVMQQVALSYNDQQRVYAPGYGGSMAVSNQFNHAFADQWGNVVYTDSHSFDPNVNLTGNWDELRPIRY